VALKLRTGGSKGAGIIRRIHVKYAKSHQAETLMEQAVSAPVQGRGYGRNDRIMDWSNDKGAR
jgi:hypothetical protein